MPCQRRRRDEGSQDQTRLVEGPPLSTNPRDDGMNGVLGGHRKAAAGSGGCPGVLPPSRGTHGAARHGAPWERPTQSHQNPGQLGINPESDAFKELNVRDTR